MWHHSHEGQINSQHGLPMPGSQNLAASKEEQPFPRSNQSWKTQVSPFPICFLRTTVVRTRPCLFLLPLQKGGWPMRTASSLQGTSPQQPFSTRVPERIKSECSKSSMQEFSSPPLLDKWENGKNSHSRRSSLGLILLDNPGCRTAFKVICYTVTQTSKKHRALKPWASELRSD